MKVKNIHVQPDIKNSQNDMITFFVDVGTDYIYQISLATLEYVQERMKIQKMNYFRSSYPVIIVEELTQEIIQKTVEDYAEKAEWLNSSSGYWLRTYNFSEMIEEKMFERLKAEDIAYHLIIDECVQLEELKDLKTKELEKFRLRISQLDRINLTIITKL